MTKPPVLRLTAGLLATTLVAGCATSPIGVTRMNPRTVARTITANALTEGVPSLDTTNALHRFGLYEDWKKKPADVIRTLHAEVLRTDDADLWFALAELSFLHADKSRGRQYSLMASIYAWSYLFGGDAPDPLDPRERIAADIYNRGLTQGLDRAGDDGVEPKGGSGPLPIGQLDVAFDDSVLAWNGRRLHDFVPVAELEVHGLNNRFRTPGIGAPLSASAAVPNPEEMTNEFLAPRLRTPVTALMRFDDVRRQVASGNVKATLELHTDPNEKTVRIAGRDVPLEKEPSASLAAMVAEAPVIVQELSTFFGKLTGRIDQGVLVALRPHVRGRIPVVFVHGTGSSPARWAEMVNVLDNDPRVNQRFEPWFFAYKSSSPIVYSSYLLRDKLQKAVAALDPEGTDADLRRMVVVGHSQGGLLTKMTAVDSGDAIWKNISSKPFDEFRLDDDDRALLRQVVFVKPLPFVERVVFICTPHRGSFLAASGFVRGLIGRLVSLPATVTTVMASAVTLNPDFARYANLRSMNAVDNMSPSNAFVRTLSAIPVDPGVKANSIIAVETDGPIEDGNDGVVEYRSAHVDGVESEKVVHSNHSTQAVPDTIEEVRRILYLHGGIPEKR